MPMNPSEFAIVRAQETHSEIRILANFVADQILQRPSGPPPYPVDGRVLIEVARLHKLVLFLPRSATDLPAGCADVPALVDVTRLRTLQLNHQSLAVATEVSESLNRAGVAHMHFKGPLQQVALYGDMVRKPVSDADILVRKADHKRACTLLEQAGYIEKDRFRKTYWSFFLGEIHYQKGGKGSVVDLHHSVQQRGLPMPYLPDLFIERAVSMTFNGQTYPVASPADICLIAGISVAKALYAKEPCGALAADFWAAWRRMDTAEQARTLQLAKAHGLFLTLCLAVRVVEAMFAPNAHADFAEWSIPNPIPTLDEAHLAGLAWQPWRTDIPQLHRRTLLMALCAGQPIRLARESVRTIASYIYGRGLNLLRKIWRKIHTTRRSSIRP